MFDNKSMANENPVSISEAELNSVLISIKDVNTKNIHEDYKLGVGISQAELEKVLKSSSSHENAKKTEKMEREEKIALRNAHAAEVMEKANAKLPKTVSVVYGTTRKESAFISGLKQGDSIELDRLYGQPAEILVNGTVFAHGMLEENNGHACVKIIDIV